MVLLMRHGLLIVAALATVVVTGCGPLREGGAPAEAAWPGRLHRLPPWGWGAPGLAINVPEGYERGLRAEEDFLVHLFRRAPGAAPPDAATMGIYVGHNPRDSRTQAITEPGRIAGRDVTWYGGTRQDEKGRTVYQAEAYVDDLFKTGTIWRLSIRGLVTHVFIWGTDKAQVEALMESAKSLRLDTGK